MRECAGFDLEKVLTEEELQAKAEEILAGYETPPITKTIKEIAHLYCEVPVSEKWKVIVIPTGYNPNIASIVIGNFENWKLQSQTYMFSIGVKENNLFIQEIEKNVSGPNAAKYYAAGYKIIDHIYQALGCKKKIMTQTFNKDFRERT